MHSFDVNGFDVIPSATAFHNAWVCDEAIIYVCSLVKSHDFVSFGSTCGEFEMFLENVSLWKRILKIELVRCSDASNEPTSIHYHKGINLALYLATHRNGEFGILIL